LLAEANSEARKEDEFALKSKEYKSRAAKNKEESMASSVSSELSKVVKVSKVEKRCEQMCELMATFLANCSPNNQLGQIAPVVPGYARLAVYCFRCGAPGHFANQCNAERTELKTPVSNSKAVMQCYGCHEFGHIARSCPNMNKAAAKPAEQIRVGKGWILGLC